MSKPSEHIKKIRWATGLIDEEIKAMESHNHIDPAVFVTFNDMKESEGEFKYSLLRLEEAVRECIDNGDNKP